MNRTPFAIIGIVGLGAAIGLSVSAGFAEPTAQVRGVDEKKITALRKERRDALLEASDAAEQMYRIARSDYASVGRLKAELLNAELDLAPDHAARVAVRERLVEQLREIEQAVNGRVEAARAVRSELLEAKAARLKAEIDLALELATPDPKNPSN